MIKKSYTLIWTVDHKGIGHIKTECLGYTGVEVLGLLELKAFDIKRQLAGEIKPKIEPYATFDRTVLVKKKKSKKK